MRKKVKVAKRWLIFIKKTWKAVPIFEAVHKTKGIESEVRISADKKIVHQSVTLDLNKIDIDEAAAAFGVTNQEDTVFERLKDKPEDFFEAIKEQGLTEE